MEFHVEDQPDPLDVEFLETQIRHEASSAMGLGDEVELAIFVRENDQIVAGVSGWTWGNCCELQSLWVHPDHRGHFLGPQLLAAAEAEAAARGCRQTVHFTYEFQTGRLYELAGYELIGRVEDFPTGTDVLWYRKRLSPPQDQSVSDLPTAQKLEEQAGATIPVGGAAQVEPSVTRAIGEAEGHHVKAIKEAIADAQTKRSQSQP